VTQSPPRKKRVAGVQQEREEEGDDDVDDDVAQDHSPRIRARLRSNNRMTCQTDTNDRPQRDARRSALPENLERQVSWGFGAIATSLAASESKMALPGGQCKHEIRCTRRAGGRADPRTDPGTDGELTDGAQPSQEDPAHAAEPAPEPVPQPRVRRRFLPRNVKIALMVLLLFSWASTSCSRARQRRREAHQLSHLNVIWLILARCSSGGAGGLHAADPQVLSPARLTAGVSSASICGRWPSVTRCPAARCPAPPPATGCSPKTTTCRAAPPPSAWPPRHRLGRRAQCHLLVGPADLHPPAGLQPALTASRPFSACSSCIFAAVIFLLTRGEKHAAVFLKKVADRLPFVRAETVTALVQKVADRMKILFTSSDLLMKAGGWAAPIGCSTARRSGSSSWRSAHMSTRSHPGGLRARQHLGRHPHHAERLGVVESP